MGFWELPNDWRWMTVGDVISSIKTGTTPPSKNDSYYDGNIAWYSPGDIGANKILVHSSRTITDIAVKDNKARLFEPETLLITCIGNIGRAGIVKSTVSSNQQITGITLQPGVLVDFAYWWIRTIQNHLQNLASKAVIPILNQTNLKLVEIPIPYPDDPTRSLAEQRRIVARIEALFAELRGCRALNEKIRVETEKLFRSFVFSRNGWAPTLTPMNQLVQQKATDVAVQDDELYHFAGVKSFGRGVFSGKQIRGSETS